MPDPYQPELATFAFAADEQAVVLLALASPKPWEYTPPTEGEIAALRSAKARILAFHLARHGDTCCYCRTSLHGAGPFMTDREHVLPKSKAAFRPFSYALWNLAAACKRCNLQFKGAKEAFVVDRLNPLTFQTSANYRFIHPNFDRWEHHLARVTVQFNAKTLIKYVAKAGCAKAAYTRDFFRLKDLEIDSFDMAQGLDGSKQEGPAALALRALKEAFEQ